MHMKSDPKDGLRSRSQLGRLVVEVLMVLGSVLHLATKLVILIVLDMCEACSHDSEVSILCS